MFVDHYHIGIFLFPHYRRQGMWKINQQNKIKHIMTYASNLSNS